MHHPDHENPFVATPFGTPPGRIEAPSLVQLATDALRRMILGGQLRPGERLIEDRLTEQLGISRPPLREALQSLAREGLITRVPRRGAIVTKLDESDVREILDLRAGFERLAVELGVPCDSPERLQRCRQALRAMQDCAERDDRAQLVERGYDFHLSIVDLSGHRRLTEFYRSLHQQLLLCMAMNLYTREHHYESLTEHVARHEQLLRTIEAGDPQAVLAELAQHGEGSFTRHLADQEVE
ncbi:GntR family transcriptional regulator [Saccharopolyspora sp. K220]|uniref:GntR family transcriptional regulator n=1 Tax=Saccharopolyspora soli TaxID=2926618 RepID=UPI001F5A5F17|nr:GntR family transcriptional regulator [Saccharopolyspora soli]MCI2417863.1 GntR family transcriptional regulator [Saccharopolyspora soli]